MGVLEALEASVALEDCTEEACMEVAMVTVTDTNMVILMGDCTEATATNMATRMEGMAGMARGPLTLTRTTLLTLLSPTEELQRLIPRLMLKQVLALEAMGSGVWEDLGLGASEVMALEVMALEVW